MHESLHLDTQWLKKRAFSWRTVLGKGKGKGKNLNLAL